MLLSGHLALCRRRTIVPDAGLANPQFLYPVVIQQIQGTCRQIHRFIFVFTSLWCPAFLPPVLSAKILLEADSGQREAGHGRRGGKGIIWVLSQSRIHDLANTRIFILQQQQHILAEIICGKYC